MTEAIAPAVQCPTERAILHALVYFEVFSYPLTGEEIYRFSNCPGATGKEVEEKLQGLVKQGVVLKFDSFYTTQNRPDWVLRRLECNRCADRMLPIARRMARFIGGFPYIRAVFISGSLSKHCMQADSDIDFFLITEPGRLWLARTLLVIFKKIFLLNSRKYFCVNYFVDTEHLEIEERNLFTATEIVTLLPLYGQEWYEAFQRANAWARAQYPHCPPRPPGAVPAHRRSFFKKALEWLLGGRPGDWLDAGAMGLTVGFWKRKFGYLDAETFDLALKSRRYLSKHHPLHFQEKVLKTFAKRLKDIC